MIKMVALSSLSHYLISAEVETQPMLRGNGTDRAASNGLVTRPSLSMIGSAMIEDVRTHAKRHDGGLLTLYDRFRQLVAWTSSGHKLKQSMYTPFRLGTKVPSQCPLNARVSSDTGHT